MKIFEKIWLFLFIVAIPSFVIFFTILTGEPMPEWKLDDKWEAYLQIFLSGKVTVYFLPFFIFSQISALLLLWKPEKYIQSNIVKVGVVSGVFLAFVYTVLAAMLFGDNEILFSILYLSTGLILALPYLAILKLRNNKFLEKYWKQLFCIGLVAIIFTELVLNYFRSPSIIMVILLFLMLVSPLNAFLGGIYLIHKSLKSEGKKISIKPLYFFAWISTYLATLNFAIQKVLSEYEKLPDEPPHECYIATASANASFVKSWESRSKKGTFLVTKQLQNFKLFEIVWRESLPKSHMMFRKLYDFLGKKLAKIISQSEVLATFSYIALLPIELFVTMISRILVKDFAKNRDRIYKK